MKNNPLVQKYLALANAKSGNNERFAHVDGNSAVVDMGAGVAAQASTSMPYVITLSNASGVAVSNFDVFGAYQYLQNAGFSNGNLTISGVTISSGFSNVTYQQLLYQSQTSPFSIGQTYISVTSGSNGQINQPITVNSGDASGRQALLPLTPAVSPFQYQSGIIVLPQQYNIDGFTKLTISSILASTVFQIQFFPVATVNLSRGVAGQNVGKQFVPPSLNLGGSVKLVN